MRSRRRVLGDFEQETLRGSRKCTVACILGRGGLGPSSGLGGARKSAEGGAEGTQLEDIFPNALRPNGRRAGTGRWTVPQAAEPRGSVRALPLWWANGRLGLLGTFPDGQVNRWPYKQKHADTQAQGHTDHTHRDVHKAVHGDKHMQEYTCTETRVCAHKHIHICTHAHTHRGACFSGCLLPAPPTSYSFSPLHPLPRVHSLLTGRVGKAQP